MISKSTKKSRKQKLYYLQEIPVVRMLSVDSKRDFWLVTVLYKSGGHVNTHVNTLNVEANLLQSASFAV
jgi:hypothetical protein